MRQKRSYGAILDIDNIRGLEEKRDLFFPFSLILHNTKPVGHQVMDFVKSYQFDYVECCYFRTFINTLI